MNFKRKYKPDGTFDVLHFSNERFVQKLDDTDRLWPEYLDHLAMGRVEDDLYVCPWTFSEGRERSDGVNEYLRNDGRWIVETDQSWLDYIASGGTAPAVEPYVAPPPPPVPTDAELALRELSSRDDRGGDVRAIEDLADIVDPERALLPAATWARIDERRAIRARL